VEKFFGALLFAGVIAAVFMIMRGGGGWRWKYYPCSG